MISVATEPKMAPRLPSIPPAGEAAPLSAEQRDPGAPYSVSYGYYGEHVEILDSFGEALSRFTELCRDAYALQYGGPALTGAALDYDCDNDGMFMCSDGLTAEQRDAIRAVREIMSGS